MKKLKATMSYKDALGIDSDALSTLHDDDVIFENESICLDNRNIRLGSHRYIGLNHYL